MANVVTQTFNAGFRLIDGTDLNTAFTQVNAAFAGTTPVDAFSVTGNLTVGGYLDRSTGAALTAVGTNRATALALTKSQNFISTAASGTGVVLPAASTVGVGGSVTVFNGGANAIKVYGAGSDTIDGTAGSTGVTLTNALRCQYFVSAAATWISAQLGAVSA